jgi:predicted transcriptional regulator
MPRSNLEIYVDILECLVIHNYSGLSMIMCEASLNKKTVTEHLDFLITNQFVNRIRLGRKSVYTITPKGMLLLKTFKCITDAFQLEEKEVNPFIF